ncbi:MAG: CsgG/HfaB family protein [Phycisphaerae bacterium]
MLRRFRGMFFVAMGLVAANVGCDKKLVVAQYPGFYTPDLKVVAIAPFENLTDNPNAGRAVSDQLAARLMHNGTYQVLDRARLNELMNEQDLMTLRGETPPGLDRLQGTAQAILVGSVTAYSRTNTRPESRRDPVPRVDRNGNPYTDYVTWTYVKNEGIVQCSAQLLRIPDGKPIYGTGSVTGRMTSESTPPPQQAAPAMDPNACLAEANRQAVEQLTEHFAVVQKEIKVDKDALITAASPDSRAEKSDKFFADSPIFIVVRLPDAAARNTFELVVSNRDTKQNLCEYRMLWNAGNLITGQYIEIPPGQLPPGKYEIKLYSKYQQKHALDTKFEIEPVARNTQQASLRERPTQLPHISGG